MTEGARISLMLALVVALVAAGEARAARVLLVDASDEPGAARSLLQQTADLLAGNHGVTVNGPLLFEDLSMESLPERPAPGAAEIALDDLLDQAERHYADFRPDEARSVLARAGRALAPLPPWESAPWRVRAHWLHVQIALYDGEADRAVFHLTQIVRLSPAWELPAAYQTPELSTVLEEARAADAGHGVRIGTTALSADTRLSVDGLAVAAAVAEVPVVVGRHVVTAQRPGFLPRSQRVDLGEGESWEAADPDVRCLELADLAVLGEALDGVPSGRAAAVLSGVSEHTGADLVVVAGAALDGDSRAVRAILYSPEWETRLTSPLQLSAGDLAREAIALLRSRGEPGPGRAVQPSLAASLGGAVRLTAPRDTLIASAGGLSIGVRGGVLVSRKLEILGLASADILGPASLYAGSGGAQGIGSQSSYLVRLGAQIGPRLSVPRLGTLSIQVGGGFCVGRTSTRVGDERPEATGGGGGWIGGDVGLAFTASPGIDLGPFVSYSHAWIRQDAVVGDGAEGHTLSSSSIRALEMGIRVAFSP